MISIPLTSYTWLQVEEANFTITAIPSGSMTEAQTISCLRVAFIHTPRGSGGVAAARYKKQIFKKNMIKTMTKLTAQVMAMHHLSMEDFLLIWT